MDTSRESGYYDATKSDLEVSVSHLAIPPAGLAPEPAEVGNRLWRQ